jgi:hypothetical protein
MGYNTAVVLLNDTMHEVESDPEFGRELAQHCRRAESAGGQFNHGPHGSKALPPAHSSTLQIVGVGGNTIRQLGFASLGADDLAVVKAMALRLGYRLTRIPDQKEARDDR